MAPFTKVIWTLRAVLPPDWKKHARQCALEALCLISRLVAFQFQDAAFYGRLEMVQFLRPDQLIYRAPIQSAVRTNGAAARQPDPLWMGRVRRPCILQTHTNILNPIPRDCDMRPTLGESHREHSALFASATRSRSAFGLPNKCDVPIRINGVQRGRDHHEFVADIVLILHDGARPVDQRRRRCCCYTTQHLG